MRDLSPALIRVFVTLGNAMFRCEKMSAYESEEFIWNRSFNPVSCFSF